MFKNKVLNIMIIILVALTLIGVVVGIILYNLNKDPNEVKEKSIDEILELTVETEEITTNLYDDGFIVLKLKIQTDNKKAKEELEKRMFQVKNIMIQELSSMKSEEFKGKEGLIEAQNILKMRLNEIMKEGTIDQVYITDFVLQ